MKSKMLAAAVLALSFAAAPSHAAGTWIGVKAGLNLPTGDFGDVASLGYFAGATGTVMMSEQFGLGGDLVFHSFGVDNDYEEAEAVRVGSTVDISLSALQITPHAMYVIPTNGDFKPFVRLGLGLYRAAKKLEASGGGDSNDSSTDFGFNVGVGGMKKASDKMAYGVELLYHSISTEGDSSNLFTVGGKLVFGGGR